MAYWLDEGRMSGKNSSNFRVFNCDDENDILSLPTNEKEGEPQMINGYLDNSICKKCALGSECLVIGTGIGASAYKLGSDSNKGINGWVLI